MKQILVDENLPPGLTSVFELAGISAQHLHALGFAGRSDSVLAAIRNEGQVVLFKVGNMRIGEVLRFAARHAEIIAEFLASGDQVIVLRR